MAPPHHTLAIAVAIFATAASSSSLAAAAALDDDYVALHNAARAAAGAGPVGWDHKAARRAAERATAACTGSGSWTTGGAATAGRYGENVFRGAPGKAWAAADAVRAWTAPEAREHAQVLWPGSTKVGCARAVCGGVVISCSYQPAGKIFQLPRS
jgi:pathogenesis-related protein 1